MLNYEFPKGKAMLISCTARLVEYAKLYRVVYPFEFFDYVLVILFIDVGYYITN